MLSHEALQSACRFLSLDLLSGELCIASQDCLWAGRSQGSQPQKSQDWHSSALPQLRHPAKEQKTFAQAQHDANTATLLLEHDQLTQDRLRGSVELMKSCLYTQAQDQL